jgi:threonyl-tRNA synthetase
MLHRALFGSLERFIGILLEQSGGRLAAWLAPEQVRVLPVSDSQRVAASALADELRAREVRAECDVSAETLPLRIYRAHSHGVPFAVILGNREIESGSVTVRERGGGNRTMLQTEALAFFRERCMAPL